MSANGLSFGQDATITFIDSTGVQQFTILESFTSSENVNVTEKVAMDSGTRFPKLHMGWKGTFVYQRNSNVLDNYIALQEAGFYAGVDQIPATITQTITENNGSVSQYIYTNVVIVLEDAGHWSGTDTVTQTFSFNASRKQQLA